MTRRVFLAISAGAVLRAEPKASWFALNLQSGKEQFSYEGVDRPVSMGSLLKPFLALAYLQAHRGSPTVQCEGVAAGCWKPGGHGTIQLPQALAQSCNVYFEQLASTINRAALDGLCLRFGLECPAREWSAARLIGREQGWPQTPRAVVRAFAAMTTAAREPAVGAVLNFLALCAQEGTARACGLRCYAKTGTAACSHLNVAPGDGYAVALYPTPEPRWAVLVMKHGTTGANAAGSLRPIVGALC